MLILIYFFLIITECYITSFNIKIRNNMINSVSNFMNLNDILIKNDYTNNMRIEKINNSSIIFNYRTYSLIEDYIYNNIYLIKNKNTYLIKYTFQNFNDEYKYLIFIKAFNKSSNRTNWNLKIKYNRRILTIILKTLIHKINLNLIIIKYIFWDYWDYCLTTFWKKLHVLLD